MLIESGTNINDAKLHISSKWNPDDPASLDLVVADVFEAVDKDHSGFIELEEFRVWAASIPFFKTFFGEDSTCLLCFHENSSHVIFFL